MAISANSSASPRIGYRGSSRRSAITANPSIVTSAPARNSGLPVGSTSSGTRAEFSTRRRSADRGPPAAAMSIEPRPPPPQFAAKLRRALGGRAGGGGFFVQILFVAVLAWIGYELVAKPRANLQAQRITSGFGFLNNTAGFDVSQSLIPYSGSDTYSRVFLVGLVNTLVVAIIGIFFATIIGFIVAIGPYLRRLCRTDPQPAAAVPDPVLVSRRARGAAKSAAEHFAVRQRFPLQPRVRDSEADRQSRFRAFRIRRSGWDRRFAAVAVVCAPPAVRERPDDPDLALCARPADRPAASDRADLWRAGQLRNSRTQGVQFLRRLAANSGIRGADAGAVDLNRSPHRRDRARRNSVGSQGTDGGRRFARAIARLDLAADRGAAGVARDLAAAHQPVSQSHQDLLTGGGDRISRSGLGLRRHHAEPDRTGH